MDCELEHAIHKIELFANQDELMAWLDDHPVPTLTRDDVMEFADIVMRKGPDPRAFYRRGLLR